MTKAQRTKFFNTIEQFTNHYNRNSDNTLILWFSGYKPIEMYECEKALMKFKVRMVSEEFDKVCGKTAMVIREPLSKDESIKLRTKQLFKNAFNSKSGQTLADTEVLKALAKQLGFTKENLE